MVTSGTVAAVPPFHRQHENGRNGHVYRSWRNPASDPDPVAARRYLTQVSRNERSSAATANRGVSADRKVFRSAARLASASAGLRCHGRDRKSAASVHPPFRDRDRAFAREIKVDRAIEAARTHSLIGFRHRRAGSHYLCAGFGQHSAQVVRDIIFVLND